MIVGGGAFDAPYSQVRFAGRPGAVPYNKRPYDYNDSVNRKAKKFPSGEGNFYQRTYSITIRRLGSVPVEWVVMLSISCNAEWIT